MNYGAYDQTRSRRRSDITPEMMAAEGRRPSYDSLGRIRGYRSRPGAPLSARDSMADSLSPLGVNVDSGGFSNDSTWNNFFSKPSAPAPSNADIPGLDPTITPMGNPNPFPAAPSLVAPPQNAAQLANLAPMPSAKGYLSAAADSADLWFKNSGGADAIDPSASGGIGSSFSSKYGTGFSTSAPAYTATLSKLGATDDFQD